MSVIADIRRALNAREDYRLTDSEGYWQLDIRDARVWGKGVMRIETPHGRIYAESAIVVDIGHGTYHIIGHRDGRPSGYLEFHVEEDA